MLGSGKDSRGGLAGRRSIRRADLSRSSIPGPAAAPGLGLPRRRENGGSASWSSPGTEPRDRDRRGCCRRRGRARGGGRRWVAGDRRRGGAGVRIAVRLRAGRNLQPLRPRPRAGSGRSNRRLRRPQRRHRGPDRRRRGERPPLSQQRLARHLRRGPRRGVSRCEGAHLVETARGVLGPGTEISGLDIVDDLGDSHTDPAIVLVSNNPYALGGPFSRGARPTLSGGRLGIVVIDRPATGRRPQVARGAPFRCGSMPPAACTPGSTAKRSSCQRRSSSRSGRRRCGSERLAGSVPPATALERGDGQRRQGDTADRPGNPSSG